jgi:hypothetical protein
VAWAYLYFSSPSIANGTSSFRAHTKTILAVMISECHHAAPVGALDGEFWAVDHPDALLHKGTRSAIRLQRNALSVCSVTISSSERSGTPERKSTGYLTDSASTIYGITWRRC